MAQFLMNAMPECDVNVATLWSTAIPVYFSGKGRPAIFMQHYEEVFYPMEKDQLTNRLLTRFALSLPIYKMANSSWLAKQFERALRTKHSVLEQRPGGRGFLSRGRRRACKTAFCGS